MSQGCFFKKLPISFPYRVTVRVGQRFTPETISQVTCQNAVMELGRLSFTERLKKKLLLKDLLNKQIFKRRDGLFFQEEDGTQILHTDFVRMVRGTGEEYPVYLKSWIEDIRGVIEGNQIKQNVVLSNWMRLQETHFWDYQKIKVMKADQIWLGQFLPWAGILWGRSIYDQGDSYLLVSKTAKVSSPIITLSGLAIKKVGIVTLNAFSDSLTLPEQNESKQKVYKENTEGRLLVGFSTFEKEGACYVLGLPNEEEVKISGFDEEGFVLSSRAH
jgi:hypothetical protein